MTTQQAYEMIRTYLGRPGAKRAAYENGMCAYETTVDGELHRCAVGCLFTPDGLNETVGIDEEMASGYNAPVGEVRLKDFTGALEGLYAVGYQAPELYDVDKDFLCAAQCVHDNDANWQAGTVIQLLDEAAERYGLTVVKDETPEGAPRRELVPA